MTDASENINKYFDYMKSEIKKAYKVAEDARKKGLDPEEFVEIPMVENMAERVEGLISVIAPQIRNSGVSKRIKALEDEYGSLNWRVALTIGLEVAQEKYCKFNDQKEAIEIGIRTSKYRVSDSMQYKNYYNYIKSQVYSCIAGRYYG